MKLDFRAEREPALHAGIQLPLPVEASPAPSLLLQPFTLKGEGWGTPATELIETVMLERQESCHHSGAEAYSAGSSAMPVLSLFTPRSFSCTLSCALVSIVPCKSR